MLTYQHTWYGRVTAINKRFERTRTPVGIMPCNHVRNSQFIFISSGLNGCVHNLILVHFHQLVSWERMSLMTYIISHHGVDTELSKIKVQLMVDLPSSVIQLKASVHLEALFMIPCEYKSCILYTSLPSFTGQDLETFRLVPT